MNKGEKGLIGRQIIDIWIDRLYTNRQIDGQVDDRWIGR